MRELIFSIASLVREVDAAEVEELKGWPGKELAVGGAGLAAAPGVAYLRYRRRGAADRA
jgi:hypothetical protein